MKSTKKLLCSLFAIVAVAFMIGSAFAGVAGETNGADADGGEDAGTFLIVGYDDSGQSSVKHWAEKDSLKDAIEVAKEYLGEGYNNVSITVTKASSWTGTGSGILGLPENIKFVISNGSTFKLGGNKTLTIPESSMLIVEEGSEFVIDRTAEPTYTNDLYLAKKTNLSATGKVTVKNGGSIKIGAIGSAINWIGSIGSNSMLMSNEVTLTTSGDSETGYEFGVHYTTVAENDVWIGTQLKLGQFDTLDIADLKKVDFGTYYGLEFEKGAKVLLDGEVWIGEKGMLEYGISGSIKGAYEGLGGLTVELDEMHIATESKVTLSDSRINYVVGELDIDGTLILNKEIKISNRVVITGTLVLGDRDYLCPVAEEIEYAVEVEVDGGVIILGASNKWYGKGAALDPSLISDVELTLVNLGEGKGVSYIFTIKGIVTINSFEDAIFDIRGKDLIAVTTGFVFVDGLVSISEFDATTGGGATLPLITSEAGKFVIGYSSVIKMTTLSGDSEIIVGSTEGYMGAISLVKEAPTEKELASLAEIISDPAVIEKIRLKASTIMLIGTNGDETARGLKINVAGGMYMDGMNVGPNDVIQVVGKLHIGNVGHDPTLLGTHKVTSYGSISVIGEFLVSTDFESAQYKTAILSVIGTTDVSNEDTTFAVAGHKYIGPTTDYDYTIHGEASISMSHAFDSLSKKIVVIVTDSPKGTGVDDYVDINKDLILDENTFFLVGYSYVKIDKEKEFLGLSEDDLASLNSVMLEKYGGVEIVSVHGDVNVTNGVKVIDTVGYRFLIVDGTATFEYGGEYAVNGAHIVGIKDAEHLPYFALWEAGSFLTIRSNEISERVLEMLVKEDPNTPYKNLLLGKSYVLTGKITVNGYVVKYNEAIVYSEANTWGAFNVQGIAIADGKLLVGDYVEGTTTPMFELTTLISSISLSYTDTMAGHLRAIAVYNLVTLYGDLEVSERDTLIIKDTESVLPGVLKTRLTVKGSLNVTDRQYLHWADQGMNSTVVFVEGSKLILESKPYIGIDTNCILRIYENASITLSLNDKAGVDALFRGHVTLQEGMTLHVADKDKVTVTSIDGTLGMESFIIRGTLIVDSADNFVISYGSVSVYSTATIQIGEGDDNVIFGPADKAKYTIGETAHVLVSDNLFDGIRFKVKGQSQETSTITLNKEKELELSDDSYIILYDSHFVIDEKAKFTVANRNCLATVVTPEYKNEDFTPAFMGVGGVAGPVEEDPCCTIDINEVDEEGTRKFVDYNTYNEAKRSGFWATGGIAISTKILIEATEDMSVQEILSTGFVNKVTLGGFITKGDNFTINEGDTFEMIKYGEGKSTFQDASDLIVKGTLDVKTDVLTLQVVKTEGTGTISITGNSETSVMIDNTQFIGGAKGMFLFDSGKITTLVATTNEDGGCDGVVVAGGMTLRSSYTLDAHDSIKVEKGASLTLDAALTIEGTLIVGTDGNLMINDNDYLVFVADKGQLKLLVDSTVVGDDSSVLVGKYGTDNAGTISVIGEDSVFIVKNVTVTSDKVVEKWVLSGDIIVNKKQTLELDANNFECTEGSTLYVGGSATLKVPEDVKEFSFAKGLTLAFGPKTTYMVGDTCIIGDNKVHTEAIFTLNGDVSNPEGFFKVSVSEGKRTITLVDGEVTGIFVYVMNKYTLTDGDSIEIGEKSTLTISQELYLQRKDPTSETSKGPVFTVNGTLNIAVTGNLKMDDGVNPLKFNEDSTLIVAGVQVIGKDAINVVSGYLAVSTNSKDEVHLAVNGIAAISKGAVFTVGKVVTKAHTYTVDLTMIDNAIMNVYGTFDGKDMTKFTMGAGTLNFFAGSAFNVGETKIIGNDKDAKLVLSELGEEPNGYLSFVANESKGYDMRLTYYIQCTVQNEFTVHSVDTFVVGHMAKLVVGEKGVLTIDADLPTKTKATYELTVKGMLEIVKGGVINLVNEGEKVSRVNLEYSYEVALISNSKVVVGGLGIPNAIVTMINEGGIYLYANDHGGKNIVLVSEVRVNGGETFDLKDTDTVTIKNKVHVVGEVNIPDYSQIVVDDKEKAVVILFEPVIDTGVATFKVRLSVAGECLISAYEEHSPLFLVNDEYTNIAFVYKNGMRNMVIDGKVTLTRDYVIEKNEAITLLGYPSAFTVKEDVTLTNMGRMDLEGVVTFDGDFKQIGGIVIIRGGSEVSSKGMLVIGYTSDAQISIDTTLFNKGFVAIDARDSENPAVICNGNVAINYTMVIPEKFKLVLDNCNLDVYGSLNFVGEYSDSISMRFDSSIAIHVGTSLTEKNCTHVIIGTDNDNADYSVSGCKSPLSKIMIATNSEFGKNGIYVMSGPAENFTVDINLAESTIGSEQTLFIDSGATVVVKNKLTIEGRLNVHGDFIIAEDADYTLAKGGNMHFGYGARMIDGEDKIISYDEGILAHNATLEMGDCETTIDILGIEDGFAMTLRGDITINLFRELYIPENSRLAVVGELKVAGKLIVDSTTSIHIIQNDPHFSKTAITICPLATFRATVDGPIKLEGKLGKDDVMMVNGNVNLCGDLILDGYFAVYGNVILNDSNITGDSRTVYIKGAICLNGSGSHQLDDFDGVIRAYEYHDGPMSYVDNGKVVVTWTLKIVTEGIPQFYWTETNKMGGFATIMIPLKENQKATITVIAGNGQVMQVSDNVWYVYSYGFDVTVKVVIEDVGPSSDYDLRINEIVDQGKHPGFTSKLVSNTEQYIATGDLEIHYVFKTLIKGKWVFSVSGFSAGVENWLTHIEASETLYSATCGGVLVKGDHVPAGSYLVSGYATFTVTDESGAKQYWVSPTIVSVSDVPVPDDQVSEIFSAVLLRTEA